MFDPSLVHGGLKKPTDDCMCGAMQAGVIWGLMATPVQAINLAGSGESSLQMVPKACTHALFCMRRGGAGGAARDLHKLHLKIQYTIQRTHIEGREKP